jgi:methylthioribose-1-phosphate isomerase
MGNKVKILDQTRLPQAEVYLETDGYETVVSAIREMRVRGAPAIGVLGAYGLALGALKIQTQNHRMFHSELEKVRQALAATRPTARNLFGALDRVMQAAAADKTVEEIKAAIVAAAVQIHHDEADATCKLSEFGSELIKDGFTILTHCNTGTLATTGCGTALGCIKRAFEQGKKIKVMATETRPLLQGARLTAWELKQAGIPFNLITDSMAGYFMHLGRVNCVITGADRIAANGDTANKIGTYSLAVLAHENSLPFYIAAPTSTIDLSLKTGDSIPIEERDPEEVTHIQTMRIAPEGVSALNPSFDVTPNRYISAIITERGIVRAPYDANLK